MPLPSFFPGYPFCKRKLWMTLSKICEPFLTGPCHREMICLFNPQCNCPCKSSTHFWCQRESLLGHMNKVGHKSIFFLLGQDSWTLPLTRSSRVFRGTLYLLLAAEEIVLLSSCTSFIAYAISLSAHFFLLTLAIGTRSIYITGPTHHFMKLE